MDADGNAGNDNIAVFFAFKRFSPTSGNGSYGIILCVPLYQQSFCLSFPYSHEGEKNAGSHCVHGYLL